MADTPNYGGAMQAANARRDAALSRLMMLAQARQRFTNMMYMKQKQQMAEAEAKRKSFEAEEKKNSTGEFFGGAAGGAGLGAMVGSIVPGIGTALGAGVGALVGGLGGAAVGMSEARAQYAKEGKHYGVGDFFRTMPGIGDISQAQRGKWDSSYINPRAIGALATTGAQVGSSMASQQGALAAGPNYANGETETGFNQDDYLAAKAQTPDVEGAFNDLWMGAALANGYRLPPRGR